VLCSAFVHVILLFAAGGLVVFHVVKKQEQKFIPPPPVERPKKPLLQPRVKMKRNVKPGGVQRIVSKAVQAVPDLQLPELEGMGAGLGGDVGGFEMMPDPTSISMFGGAKSLATGNDFEGTFYSLRYDRQMKLVTDDKELVLQIVRRFLEHNWNDRVFAPYYRAPQKLYATQFMVPGVVTSEGPAAFGIENETEFDPIYWYVHYKGRIASKEGGRFRFWGSSGDSSFVRVNGELVFAGAIKEDRTTATDWPDYLNDEERKEYNMGTCHAKIGKWFELEPGVPVDMEVLIGEGNGRYFSFMLMIEKEGEIYAENREGMPILPVFRTAEISESVKNQIKYSLIDGEADLDSPEMFNVY
jgi:hypothetical protein